MAKLPSRPDFDVVDHLVRSRFPDVNLANHELTSRQARDPEFKETRRQAEAFRLKLMELPSDELGRLLAVQVERDREAKRLKAEREERERSFNRPDVSADFEYWAKASYWTIDEAVALSLGRDPQKVKWDRLKTYRDVSTFAAEFAARRELAVRAKTMGQLWETTIPGVFVAWAARMRVPLPPDLVAAVEALGVQIADWKARYDEAMTLVTALREERQQYHDQYMAAVKDHSNTIDKFRSHMEELTAGHQRLMTGKDGLIADMDSLIAGHEETIAALTARVAELESVSLPTNKSLGTRERESLLKLVIGMAMDGYGYDPNASRSPIAREIAGHLALIDLPIDEDTVRKYLTEGRDLLSTDETERKG